MLGAEKNPYEKNPNERAFIGNLPHAPMQFLFFAFTHPSNIGK